VGEKERTVCKRSSRSAEIVKTTCSQNITKARNNMTNMNGDITLPRSSYMHLISSSQIRECIKDSSYYICLEMCTCFFIYLRDGYSGRYEQKETITIDVEEVVRSHPKNENHTAFFQSTPCERRNQNATNILTYIDIDLLSTLL